MCNDKSTIERIKGFQGNPVDLFSKEEDSQELYSVIEYTDFFLDYRYLNKTYPLIKSSAGQKALTEALDMCFVSFDYLPIQQTFLEQCLQASQIIAQNFLISAYKHLNAEEGPEFKVPPIRNYVWVTRDFQELRPIYVDNVLANKAISPTLHHIVWVYKKEFAQRSIELIEEQDIEVREISEIQSQFVDRETWYRKFKTDINLGAAVDLLKLEVANVIGGVMGDFNHDDVPLEHYMRTYDCAIYEISFFMCKPHGMLERALKHFYASHNYENITQSETRLLPFSGFLPYNASEINVKLPRDALPCNIHFNTDAKKWETTLSWDYKEYSCDDDHKICIEDSAFKTLHECQNLRTHYYKYDMCPEPKFIPGFDHKAETWDLDIQTTHR